MATGRPMEHEFPTRRPKTSGWKRRGKKKAKKGKGGRKALREGDRPAKEWEKLKKDSRNTSLAPLVSDCFKSSLRQFERVRFHPRRRGASLFLAFVQTRQRYNKSPESCGARAKKELILETTYLILLSSIRVWMLRISDKKIARRPFVPASTHWKWNEKYDMT